MPRAFAEKPFPVTRPALKRLLDFRPPVNLGALLAESDSGTPRIHAHSPVALDVVWNEATVKVPEEVRNERGLREIETCTFAHEDALIITADTDDVALVASCCSSIAKDLGLDGMFRLEPDSDFGVKATLVRSDCGILTPRLDALAKDMALGPSLYRYAAQGLHGRWYALASGAGLVPAHAEALHEPRVASVLCDVTTSGASREWPRGMSVESGDQLLAALSQLETRHVPLVGLAVLEAFYRQRDAWARRQLILGSGRSIQMAGRHRWLRVVREAPAAWSRGASPHYQDLPRIDIWRALMSLASFAEFDAPRGGQPPRVSSRLLEWVVDGRKLDQATSGPPSSLAEQLREAGIVRDDAFYVCLAREWEDDQFVHHLADDGRLTWGPAAKALIRRDRRLDRQEKARLQERIRTATYVNVDPALVIAATHRRLTTSQMALLLSLLSDQEPRARAAKADGTSIQCDGDRGYGYQSVVRMLKADYAQDPEALSPETFRRFVSDLKVLSLKAGLQIRTRRAEVVTEDGLATLNAYCKLGDIPGEKLMVLCSLPSGTRAPSVPARKRKRLSADDASDLRLLRISCGLTQAQLAELAGVARSSVTNWELGTRKAPANVMQILAERTAKSHETVQEIA